MTKKSIKKRVEEEEPVKSNIEIFCDTYEAKDTRNNYLTTLNKVQKDLGKIGKTIEKATQEELWNVIENQKGAVSTKRKYQNRVKKYLEYYKLNSKLFEKNLKKQENEKGEYVYTIDNEVIEAKKKELPSLNEFEEIKKKISNIENLEHRLLLSLICNYTEVIRCDLAKVKVRNYKPEEPHVNFKENSIVFPTINKEKYTNIILKLNETDSDILNEMTFKDDYNYLLTIGGKEVNRCNNYSALISTLTERYFGEKSKLNQTDLRHLASTASYKKKEHLPEKEKALLREKESRSRGHSSKTASQYYVEDTNDVRVCLKNKSELTIVDDNGEIEYSYNLKELIVVMEYHKFLKERI